MPDSIETTEPVAAPKTAMEITDILKILPHRYPFLLIDRVLELERMRRIPTSRSCPES